MLYPSTPVSDRKILFQAFCGRWEHANVLDHPGQVIRQMASYEWKTLKQQLGLTHVYLLGLWDNHGPIIVGEENGRDIRSAEHRCPSPFAISDHSEINPLLGSGTDFKYLIDTLHEAGLRVLVDFVPNHTGLNHPWLTVHRDYYKGNPDGSPKTAFSGDVAELNYENPGLCGEMIGVLNTIASLNADGVRCDMAHLVPVSFWKKAVETVRSAYPDFEFIAEAYSDNVFDLKVQKTLLTAGFDAVYDEPLFRNIKAIAGGSPVEYAVKHVLFEIAQEDRLSWLHYISNHDDPFPQKQASLPVWQAFISMLPGWHLIYNGNLWGFEGRLAHHTAQILQEVYVDPVRLPKKVTEWFSWLQETKPVIEKISLTNESEIQVSWRNSVKTGNCRFVVSGESPDIYGL